MPKWYSNALKLSAAAATGGSDDVKTSSLRVLKRIRGKKNI
jgi:hypothetical protein